MCHIPHVEVLLQRPLEHQGWLDLLLPAEITQPGKEMFRELDLEADFFLPFPSFSPHGSSRSYGIFQMPLYRSGFFSVITLHHPGRLKTCITTTRI